MNNEIKNFDLKYTENLFRICWQKEGKERKWYINLTISDLLRLLEAEGYTIDDVTQAESNYKPLHFSKATLYYSTYEDGVLAEFHAQSDFYYNMVDSYYIEDLSTLDSMENHKNDLVIVPVSTNNPDE